MSEATLFLYKRLLWQTLGNKNSWAGEKIHVLLSNVLSKQHRKPNLYRFWSHLTSKDTVAGFFRKYCSEFFLMIYSKSRTLSSPANQCISCTACKAPHCALRKRQSHKVDVVTRMHKFASILTILFSLNHLFPKGTLIAQHLSATTLIRSNL